MKVRSTALIAGLTAVVTAFAAVSFVAPAQAADPIQIARLAGSDASGLMGYSVSVSGTTIVVGAPTADNGKGAVYVFERSGQTVTQVARLTASDAVDGDQIGYSVSVSGDTVVAGAPKRNSDTGAAYVFVKPGGGWANGTQTATLTASDGLAADSFAQAVAISGDNILVGSPFSLSGQGSAYIFTKPGGGWATATETGKFTSAAGGSGESYGFSVAIDGDTAVVSAPFAETNDGAAFIYTKPGSGWATATETAKLTDPAASDGNLGWSVGITGDTVIASAPATGTADIFVKSGGAWSNSSSPKAVLTATDSGAPEAFGLAAAISGDTAVVGALDAGAGSAYRYVKPSGGWASATQTSKLIPSATDPKAAYGLAVAASADTIVVGAPLENTNGVAYVFYTEPPPDPTPTPTPTPTPKPTAKKAQKPASAKGRAPHHIKKSGVTVITGKGARTNAGQLIRTRVRCMADGHHTAGEVRYCAILRGAKGKVALRTFGRKHLKVIVVQSAPPTKKYRAFVKRTVYIDGKKR